MMDEEEEKLKKLEKTKIIWIDGEPLIDLTPEPVMYVKVFEIPKGSKSPFAQLLKEIEDFMGGLSDADKKRKGEER